MERLQKRCARTEGKITNKRKSSLENTAQIEKNARAKKHTRLT